MPEVSVLLPVRNGASTLALAMISVIEQSFRDFELLVLDDGSTDASPDIALRFGDARVRLLRDGAKRGLAARLNQGIDIASGNYLARMDADDVCFPDRFLHQTARLRNDNDLDLVACRSLEFDDSGAVTGMRPYRLSHEALCAQPWNGFYMVHPSWMGRADWFRRYRYRIPEVVRAEDQELLLRAYQDSRFAVINEILLGYRTGPIVPEKVLTARRSLLDAQIAIFAQRREMRHLVLAIAAMGLKLPRDLLYSKIGRSHWWNRRRDPIAAETRMAWLELLRTLHGKLDKLNLAHGCGVADPDAARAHAD